MNAFSSVRELGSPAMGLSNSQYLLRIVVASIIGGLLHVTVLGLGLLAMLSVSSGINGQDANIDMGLEWLAYGMFVLPLTFCIGWALAFWAVCRAVSGHDRARTARFRAFVSSLALMLFFTALDLDLGSFNLPPDAKFYWYLAAIGIGPTLMAGSSTFFTIAEGDGTEPEVQVRRSTDPDPE